VKGIPFGLPLQGTRTKVSVAVTERDTTKQRCRYLDLLLNWRLSDLLHMSL